jgi:hypothetical protein
MGWNADEVPVAALGTRMARLRAAMAGAGFDALLLYTNNVRPSAVTWVTGFTPYWSDALLLVPTSGAPVFATALSKRVSEWIRTTDPLSEIVNTPRPGTTLGQRLATSRAKRVGVLEFDTLPAGLTDELAAAAPATEWCDATALFAEMRRTTDAAERGLLARADAIAVAALRDAEPGRAADAGTLAGLVEKHARLAGAEEVYVAIAPDLAADSRLLRLSRPVSLAERYAVRASVAYKGCWVRRVRTFGGSLTADADAWFERGVRTIAAGQPIASQLAARMDELPGATLASWMAESCTGSYPLSMMASSRSAGAAVPVEGQFLVLTAELSLDGAPWLGAAPLFVGQRPF